MASQAEWELEQVADFIELIGDATLASDSDGNIVLVNEAAVRQLGHPRAELRRMTVYDVTPEPRRQALRDERREYFENEADDGHGRHERHSMLCADGTEVPVEMTYSRFRTADGVIRVAVLRDITEKLTASAERDELRVRLEQSQARRMEVVGQLAGGIAHDFNNLLGVIINYADFALEGLDDRPAVRADIEEVRVAASRAAELTQQLLVFSRRRDEPRRPISLNDVILEIEQLIRRAIGPQVDLVLSLEPDLAAVVAEPNEMTQAVINLAINARDAMPEGGVLEIETSNIELDADSLASRSDEVAPGKYVRVSISDTGVGMDSETLESAFEPFFTTKASEGTGLGLSTVYGTVKSHGGNVFIYSEPGRGTVVKLHLPASSDPDSPKPVGGARPHTWTGRGERVLVVDDEQSVRRMVVRALAGNGYDVRECSRADEAIDVLMDPEEFFSLVLTDVVMPGMDGGKFADRVRELRPEVPVLFMSGYSELAMRRRNEDGEQVDLLEKPFTVNALLSEVRRVIERSKR